jgi:hypothetical protein
MGKNIRFFHYTVPAVFLIFLSFCFEFLVLFGLRESFYYLIFFPFFEEIFKYFYARRFRRASRNVIIALGAWEFLLVKVPLIDFSNFYDGSLIFLIAIVPLVFHVATAFAYSSRYFENLQKTFFFSILLLHIFYNSLDLFVEREVILFAVSIVFSMSPLFFLFFISKMNGSR